MSKIIDSEAALAAMHRARDIAWERASRFGSKVAVWKDGAIVLIDPNHPPIDEAPREDREAPAQTGDDS